jgi:hypothetical protein
MHLPHCSDHASETAEEHGSREVHRLVGRVPIAFGSLAGTEICEYSMRQVQLHDFFDRELSVLQQKAAIEWIQVLDAMASEVKNVWPRFLEDNT